jgi:hypothetical protein
MDIMTPEQYAISLSLYGGKDTKEGGDWRKKVLKKRPDIVIEAENPQSLHVQKLREEIGKMEPSDVAKLSLSTWKKPLFKEALDAHIKNLQNSDAQFKDPGKNPDYKGAGVKYKTSLRKAIPGKNDRDLNKLNELTSVAPEISAYGNETIAEEKKEKEPEDKKEEKKETPPEGGTPPKAKGVSYHETAGIPNANVIDLRNNQDIEIK